MAQESQAANELAFQFLELGDHINAGVSPAEALDRLVALAQQFVPGADWVSVTQGGAAPRCLAATDDIARTADQLQTDTNQGPCLQAAEEHTVIVSQDLATESRWPQFTAQVRGATPIRSTLAFELSEQQPPCALNLYAGSPNAFDSDSINAASLFAAHAQVAVMHLNAAAKSANLEQALTTSRQIGMALGILMSAHRITAEKAFEQLRVSSQQLQRKLRDVAREVTETGTLP